nr:MULTISPECIES: iron-containing redox enzyme family protein [unclassified Pseudomonas]
MSNSNWPRGGIVPNRLVDVTTCSTSIAIWTARRAAKVGRQYASYLRKRSEGETRQFFSNRAHPLYFLQQVAPTKAVDGAWLFGALRHWDDPRYHGLIRIYLEELGDGHPASSHVLIYQRLLSSLGCHERLPLADERYLQGSLQLALGLNLDEFLPAQRLRPERSRYCS